MVKIFIDRKFNSLLFAGVLLVCFLVSVGVRYQQFETWKKTPAAYFVGERPMMTTLDAPYWLRWAREYNEGTYGQKGGLRAYPESLDSQKPEVVQQFIDERLPRKKIAEADELIPLIALLAGQGASMMAGSCVPIDAGEGIAYSTT